MKSIITLFALVALFMSAQAFRLSTNQDSNEEVIDLSGFTDEDWDKLAEKLFGLEATEVARLETRGGGVIKSIGGIAKKIIC